MFLVLSNAPFLQGVVFRLRDLSRKNTLYPQNLKTLFYVHFSFSYFQLRRGDTGFPLIVLYKSFTLKEIEGKTHLFKENNKYYCEWYTQIWYERD